MSNVTESVQCTQARAVVVAVAKALVDAKSGEQRSRALGALFAAVDQLRKAGG